MMTDYQKIRNAIEDSLKVGKKNFIIYPYGEYGVLTKKILNDSYGVSEIYIVDNKLSEFNSKIKQLDYFKNINCKQLTVLFTCANPNIQQETRSLLNMYFDEENIVDIFIKQETNIYTSTRCGKHSYGILCNHWLVEEVGAFCSFAPGVDVVENHAINYISTSPFLYYGSEKNSVHPKKYDEYKDENWYVSGVKPQGIASKLTKIKIKNDVWLGENVIITNGANIGNGVIAGAGAVITKDVPDYAIVAGVPAKIIKYRYTKEQIDELNLIKWWEWSDEKIRECYNDFYLNVEEFIKRHKKK